MSRGAIIYTMMALALILIGTGYAYWTDSLNVTARATTGDLDVTFVNIGPYAHYDNADGYNNVEFYAGLAPDTKQRVSKKVADIFSVVDLDGSDKIEIKVENIYPGYAQAFRTDIVNIGSIGAQLSAVHFAVEAAVSDKARSADNEAIIKDMLGLAVIIDGVYPDNLLETRAANTADNNAFELYEAMNIKNARSSETETDFEIDGVNFTRLSALEAAGSIIEQEYVRSANLLLYPMVSTGQSVSMYIAVAMDPDAEGLYTTGSTEELYNPAAFSTMNTANDDSLSQNTGANIYIDLLWDQFNVSMRPPGKG